MSIENVTKTLVKDIRYTGCERISNNCQSHESVQNLDVAKMSKMARLDEIFSTEPHGVERQN